jgi:hydrogenase maturation protease
MVVCIAIGNTLREDDGVAHHALRMIGSATDKEDRVVERRRLEDQVRLLEVFQLAPELACEIASADLVFFLDADASAENTELMPIETDGAHGSPMAHSMSPAEVLTIARDLYAFAGKAFLCRIPAKRFGYGEDLTVQSKAAARSAAQLITDYISRNAMNGSRPRLVKS